MVRASAPVPGVPAARPGIAALLVLWLATLAAGCISSVRLVGDYDEVLDQAVMQLQVRTNQFYARIPEAATAVPQDEVEAFFAEAIGAVDAMAARAEVLEEGLRRDPLTRNLSALREQLQDAKAVGFRTPDVRRSSLEALNGAFRALQVQLVHMKKTQSQRPEGP